MIVVEVHSNFHSRWRQPLIDAKNPVFVALMSRDASTLHVLILEILELVSEQILNRNRFTEHLEVIRTMCYCMHSTLSPDDHCIPTAATMYDSNHFLSGLSADNSLANRLHTSAVVSFTLVLYMEYASCSQQGRARRSCRCGRCW